MKLLPTVLLLVLFSVLCVPTTQAQKSSKTTKPAAKKEGIQVGDKVEVDWAGQVVTAEVIGRNQVGWYELKFQFNGLELKPTLPPQQVRAMAKGGEKKAPAGTPGTPATAAGGTPKSGTEADWSKVEPITLGNPERWSVKVEAAPASRQKLTTKSIPLSRTLSNFVSQFHSLLFAKQKAQAFAVVVDPASLAVNMQRLDLVEGKAANPMKLPVATLPCDVDDNGEWMLSRSDALLIRGLPSCQVSLWKLGTNGVEHRSTWNPEKGIIDGLGHRIATGAMPQFARLVTADRVLTVCVPGNMTLWDATNAKAIYTLDVSPNSVPTLSPGKRSVAVSVNSGVWLLDALTGRALGRLAGDVAPSAELSFRPDGKQLAAVSPQQLQVWNLETGELYRDIYFSSKVSATKLDWLADGYVLVGGENLVDLERRVVLWQYQHADAQERTAHRTSGELGGAFWYGLTSKDRTVMSLFRADLPHALAKQTAAGLKSDDLLAVKPGTRLSLQLNVQGTTAEQEAVRAALTEKLQVLGMILAADSPVVLSASTETGESRKINYESIGKAGPAESATVTEQISRLRLIVDGRPLWESSRVIDAPFALSRKAGQSIQDALAPYQKPDLTFFSQAKIPQHVAKLNEKGTFGASLLTHQGVQPATVRTANPANAR